jgi:hypothetical protein
MPVQLETHLRSLCLLHRLVLSSAQPDQIAQNWGDFMSSVTDSIQTLIFPALSQLLVLSGSAPRKLIPPHAVMSAYSKESKLLGAMLVSDRDADKAHQEMLLPYSDIREAQEGWLHAAEAAAETLHLLIQAFHVAGRVNLDKGICGTSDLAASCILRYLRVKP